MGAKTSLPTDHQPMVLTLLRAAARVEHRLDRALSCIRGISFTEYRLLRELAARHDASATRVDLAAAVQLTPSAVTRALKPLEKLGYVRTVRDERDARRSLASLTPAGAELVRDAEGVVQDDIAALGLTSSSADEALVELVERFGTNR